MAVRVNKESFEHEVLNSILPVLVDFYSDSCVPCKRLSPVLAEMEEEYPGMRFVKVNTNFETALTEEYEVMAVPTLVFFRDGREFQRIRGAAGKAEIAEIIEKLI